MDKFFSVFGDLAVDPRIGGADSFTDRLNCRISVFICIVFAIMVTTKYYVGEPISCWCPGHFTDSQVDYTNKVCWTTNTYYLPLSQDKIPASGKHAALGAERITYYQWVALILLCQAVFFYVPRPIWRVFNKKSGIAVSTITDAAIECQRRMDPDSRDKTLRYMTKHMGRFLIDLNRNHMMANRCKSIWYAFYGNYLIVLYIFIKLLYIANVVGQIFMLNSFLSTDYHAYGWEVMSKLAKGEAWNTSNRFPRVTLCDFHIRVLGNIHRYTVQCSLPMNLLNEIIFIFLWFWFVFVLVATCGSLFMWLVSSIYIPFQSSYIRNRLIAMDRLHHASEESTSRFVRSFLRRDGCFIIRLVAKNASDLIAAELVCGLWDHYKDNRKSLERIESRDVVSCDSGL